MSSSWSGIVNEIGEEDCSSCNKNEWITPDFPSRCHCGSMVQMWEAKKDGTKHRGRRFIGCINYRDRRAYCGFFKWYDPPFPERAKDVIEDLTLKLKMSREMLVKLKNENSEKTKDWKELAELDSVKTLEKDIKKLKKITVKAQQKEKILWFLLICSWMLVGWCCFGCITA